MKLCSLNLWSVSYLEFQLMAKKAHFIAFLYMMNLPNNRSLQQSSTMSNPELLNRWQLISVTVYTKTTEIQEVTHDV